MASWVWSEFQDSKHTQKHCIQNWKIKTREIGLRGAGNDEKYTEPVSCMLFCCLYILCWGKHKSWYKIKHLIINTTALIQPIYFESALTLKFKSKDMLLWKRGSGFVSTKYWKLIPSSLKWFDQAILPEAVTQVIQQPRQQGWCSLAGCYSHELAIILGYLGISLGLTLPQNIRKQLENNYTHILKYC